MANKEKRPTTNVKKEKGTNKKKATIKTEYQRTRDQFKNGTKSYRRACRENSAIVSRRVE